MTKLLIKCNPQWAALDLFELKDCLLIPLFLDQKKILLQIKSQPKVISLITTKGIKAGVTCAFTTPQLLFLKKIIPGATLIQLRQSIIKIHTLSKITIIDLSKTTLFDFQLKKQKYESIKFDLEKAKLKDFLQTKKPSFQQLEKQIQDLIHNSLLLIYQALDKGDYQTAYQQSQLICGLGIGSSPAADDYLHLTYLLTKFEGFFKYPQQKLPTLPVELWQKTTPLGSHMLSTGQAGLTNEKLLNLLANLAKAQNSHLSYQSVLGLGGSSGFYFLDSLLFALENRSEDQSQ